MFSFSISEFKGGKLLFFVLFLVIVTFFLKILPLVLFPIPHFLNSHASDLTFHSTVIELIKKDIRYIGYEPFYPKGFHILAAAISFLMPIGAAITLITIVFSLLFTIFCFKLSMFFSKNDRLTSLISTFLAIAVTILVDVPGVPAPVPQTVGLALFVMVIYFFAKEKFFSSGILLGLYSTIHLSWPLAFFLIIVFFVINNKIILLSLKQKIFPLLASFLPIYLAYSFFAYLFKMDFVSPFTAGIATNYLGAKFFDMMVSPISFLFITKPPFMVLLALVGIVIAKKNSNNCHKFVLAWLALLFLASQSYWLGEFSLYSTQPNSLMFIGSRMVVYMFFPIAFFSSHALVKVSELSKIIALLLLLVLFAFSIPSFDLKPDLTKKELDAIEKLKQLPINAVVLSVGSAKQSTVLLLGLKVHPYKRDTILIASGLEPIDTNRIDYILVDDKEKYSIFDPAKEETIGSYNVYGYNRKIKIMNNYATSKSLRNYVAPFIVAYRNVILFLQVPLKIQATDTGEEICFPAAKSKEIGIKCGVGEYLTIKGEKSDLIALFDSFDSGLFHNKLYYLYRHGKLSFQPEPTGKFNGTERSLRNMAWLHRWVNSQSKLSAPNLWIGDIFAAQIN